MRNADGILALSETGRRQIVDALGEDRRARVTVASMGLGLSVTRFAGSRVRDRRILIFDSPFPHKRTDEAAQFALRFLVETEREDHRILVIGRGAAATLAESVPERIARYERLLNAEKLAKLIAASEVVVVSSRHEGLGLVPLEAWTLGTPAVVADCAAARESLEGLPGLYEPGNYESFRVAMSRVVSLTQERIDVHSKSIESRYSWAHTAGVTIDLYRQLAHG